jgi:flagellin
MPQTINTNLVSLNAQRNLTGSQSSLATSMQRLSSGLRVNSAKDDAAGLAIAERMNAQVRGMNVAIRNANDAISLSQTAEGALGKVGDIFQRMRELAVQSANGTNSDADRTSLNEEFVQLAQEATRTLGGTQFNGQNILQATADSTFQIGANNTSDVDRITVSAFDWTANAGITGTLGSAVITGTDVPAAQITDVASAQAALSSIDTAINSVNSQRAEYGAVQNRFENVVSTLMVASENQAAARSRIMDADYASETANLSRATIALPATRWWRSPTSCPSRCWRCCADRHPPPGRLLPEQGPPPRGGPLLLARQRARFGRPKAALSGDAPPRCSRNLLHSVSDFRQDESRHTIHRLPPRFQDSGELSCPRPSTPTSCR